MGTMDITSGSLTSIGGTYDRKIWVRRLDRVTPNPFQHSRYTVKVSGTFMRPGDCYFSDSTEYSNWRARNLNRLHAKWVDALQTQANASVSWAERKSSMTMITNRVGSLIKAVRALRKGNLAVAANALGLSKPPKGWRAKGKSFGDKWLEGYFGWAPMIGDVYNAVEILCGEPPRERITVRSGNPALIQYRGMKAAYNTYTFESGVIRQYCSASGTISISNTDLYLADSFGLINPLTVAWELVPFSFLVDWFGNVSQVLASMTGVLGVSVSNPCYSVITVTVKDKEIREVAGGPVKKGSGTAMTCVRSVGNVPGPTLKFALPPGLSWKRGVTAVSLLFQLLRK